MVFGSTRNVAAGLQRTFQVATNTSALVAYRCGDNVPSASDEQASVIIYGDF